MISRSNISPLPREVIAEGFQRPQHARLRLDRFQRGADNRRIDVALGTVVTGAVEAYTSALVRGQLQRLWGQPVSPLGESVVENFRAVLSDHERAVVKGARAVNRLERIQLYQLSLVKLLLASVDSELARLRAQLDDARSEPARQTSGQSLQFHQQAVTLGRNLEHVRTLVARELMREYLRIERGALCKLRQSVLGIAWPVPESMLGNPLLQLDGVGDSRDFYLVYPLLLRDAGLVRQAAVPLLETFADWMPDFVTLESPADGNLPSLAVGPGDQPVSRCMVEIGARIQGLFGKQELDGCAMSWLDHPDNAENLLGGGRGDWPRHGPWLHSAVDRLQRDLNKKLSSALNNAGLMRAIGASYELQAVYPQTRLAGAEVPLFDFLGGSLGRRALLKRLEALDGGADPAAALRRIEDLRRAYRTGQGADKRQLVARFAADVLRFRRDLKLAWHACSAMGRVRLVSDEGVPGSEYDDHRVQIFCRRNAAVETAGSVVGHVIVRAEIRGIARITSQMSERSLDPAAHFSRHFYDPLTRLAEQFGARKVVVESDALILSLLEHSGEGAEGLAVARGCCVAAKLIELTDRMNAEHARLGLRHMELGVGVAYADEPPTFLYDHARRVTISPAIQRARSLSSCHPLLRTTCSLPGGRGLCVASQVDEEGDAEPDDMVRCNVNAIEIDAAAFTQLNVEIVLRRLRQRGTKAAILYAGYCTDVKGENHWLLVRERDVALWIGAKLHDAGGQGRRFFEVVSDTRLIERVRRKLAADEPAETDSTPSDWR